MKINLQQKCPSCKSSVALEYVQTGPEAMSIRASCASCGGEGTAPVAGVTMAMLAANPSDDVWRAVLEAFGKAARAIR